jgi:alginate O-acetyltransferase complex protein AlgI
VRTYVNLIVTMLLGGLWHGAAWNFVLWGLLHGLALSVQRLYEERFGPTRPRMPAAVGWGMTMAVVLVGWFLFRCNSWEMIRGMAASLANLEWTADHTITSATLAVLAAPVVVVEVWQNRRADLLAPLELGPAGFALLAGTMLALTVVMFGRYNYAFIYFQF